MTSCANKIRVGWRERIYAWLGGLIIRCIAWSCRFQIEGAEAFSEHSKRHRTILILWHNRLLMMSEILRRFAAQFSYIALISDSRDGDMLAYIAKQSRIGRSIRVAHDARAAALRTVIKELQKGNEILLITPDGPRGPLYKVKPGTILAAQKAKAQIIPMSWSANRYWTVGSWDGLIIPKPFARISVTFGDPIMVQQRGIDIEAECQRLEGVLAHLCDFALEQMRKN